MTYQKIKRKKRTEDEAISDIASLLYTIFHLKILKDLSSIEYILFLINYRSLKEIGKPIFTYRFFKGTSGPISITISEDIRQLLISNALVLNESFEFTLTETGFDLLEELKNLIPDKKKEIISETIFHLSKKSEIEISEEISSHNLVRHKKKGEEIFV